jgi:hypothetical protein
MATSAQIEANRQNAKLSTGPNTPEGITASSQNRITHGLAGTGTAVPGVSAEAFAVRYEGFKATLRPRGAYAEWVLQQTIAASFRIELCGRALSDEIGHLAHRAAEAWEVDRETAAAEALAKLGRDPGRWSWRLRATPQGCRMMIDLWQALARGLESATDWDDEKASLALDLLGTPHELRDIPTQIDPLDGDPIAHRLTVVRDEIARLTERAATIAPLDESDRENAMTGRLGLLAPTARLILRYERDAFRQFERGMTTLKRLAEGEPPPVNAPQPVASAPPPMVATPRPEAVAAPSVAASRPGPSPSPSRPAPARPSAPEPAYSYLDFAITPTAAARG